MGAELVEGVGLGAKREHACLRACGLRSGRPAAVRLPGCQTHCRHITGRSVPGCWQFGVHDVACDFNATS
ncbi:hypothetical protein ASZ90_002371 [hydrocarbon metagenome]|uniref:Uncharacterized protein n=1 Tax=hydrocarbon metagenome TaxID=938273 RepID=A0A0W8G3W8_9ZZZZ